MLRSCLLLRPVILRRMSVSSHRGGAKFEGKVAVVTASTDGCVREKYRIVGGALLVYSTEICTSFFVVASAI